MLYRGHHYQTGELIDVVYEQGAIVQIAAAGSSSADVEADWVSPALFDLQINGCHGISFNSPELTEADVRHVVEHCRRHGIASLFPTLVTNSFEAIAHGFRTLAASVANDPIVRQSVPGFHLEGPYISGDDGPRGAHPKIHVRSPSVDEFHQWQQAANGMIRLVTLAPELPGALDFISQVSREHVVIAIGHTAASPEQIRAAVLAGAKLSTHLGNGAHANLPRHPNYIWEQLAADELIASIIPDGHHLPASVVKSIIRGKTLSRTIITCDASSLAGSAPGRYRQWDSEFEVLDSGKIIVPGTPFLAGSGVFTDRCISTVIEQTGITLQQAIDCASRQPRELFGFAPFELAVGSRDPFMLFDWQLGKPFTVRQVVGPG